MATQNSDSIKKVPIKYFLVREDAEERVLNLANSAPSESANSAPSESANSDPSESATMPLTLQQRLTSSVEFGDVKKDLIISWDELFMGLALLEKIFINLNDKDPSKKVE